MDLIVQILLAIVLIIIIVPAIAIFVRALNRGNRRSSELVQSWADRNAYRIIKARRHYLFTGPFAQITTRGAHVYRVEIEDSHAHKRTGWLLCGSGFWGSDPDKTTVRWDK